MKKILFIVAVLAAMLFTLTPSSHAADAVKWEYAIVKWDGPDRLYYNLPDKFELVFLSKTGVMVPKDAQAEEWCLAYAANKPAKEGWETMTPVLLRNTSSNLSG